MNGKRPATYQDVLDAPDHMVAELIDGELFLSPRPAGPHASVSMRLSSWLFPRFADGDGEPGGWLILIEPELHLNVDERVVVPDLAGWRIERMPKVPEGHKFTLVPDWICEISSKSTRRIDRTKKLPLYARAGVGHAWIVDPRIRALQVYRRLETNWLDVGYYFDADKVRAEPFESVELDLGRLWRDLPAPTRVSEQADVGDELDF